MWSFFWNGTEKLAEFERRFVAMPHGRAYIGGKGDAYPISHDEATRWQEAGRRIYDRQNATRWGGCLILFGGMFALTWFSSTLSAIISALGLSRQIAGHASSAAISLGVIAIMGILFWPGIKAEWDWKQLHREIDHHVTRRLSMKAETIAPYRKRNPLILIGVIYLLVFEIGIKLLEYFKLLDLNALLGIANADFTIAPMLAMVGVAIHLAGRAIDWWQVRQG